MTEWVIIPQIQKKDAACGVPRPSALPCQPSGTPHREDEPWRRSHGCLGLYGILFPPSNRKAPGDFSPKARFITYFFTISRYQYIRWYEYVSKYYFNTCYLHFYGTKKEWSYVYPYTQPQAARRSYLSCKTWSLRLPAHPATRGQEAISFYKEIVLRLPHTKPPRGPGAISLHLNNNIHFFIFQQL